MTDHNAPAAAGQFEFLYNGRPVRSAVGQTLAGALHAQDEHILSRSFKYHRPRGLFCCSGRCPNCLCTVDGEPNVRICITPAAPGMKVESQNAWPSPKFDLLAVLDRLQAFMPVGFYYKRMYKPRRAWPIWERVIRQIAGLGRIDRHNSGGRYEKLNLFADVAVIGGGWAGLHAALAAADAGADVVLIDEQPELGGHLRHDPDLAQDAWAGMLRQATDHAGVRVLTSSSAFGCYEENLLGIRQGNRLIRLRANQVIVTTGGWERPLVFENNDRPGVLLASAVQRLMHLEHCRFAGAAVVVTDNAQGYRAARQLVAAGTSVAAIVDVCPGPPEFAADIPVFRGHTVVAVRGSRHVAGVEIAPLAGGPSQSIACRWLVQAVGFTPASALLYQNGCQLTYDPACDHAVVVQYARGMHSAGAVNGTHDPHAAALEGRLAGLAAAATVRPHDVSLAALLADARRRLDDWQARRATCAAQYVAESPAKKKFVCLCEDVTEQDLCDAVAEGYANIETLKRYSTVCMGPCQGKMCQAAAIALCARETGRTIADTGVTTARPPEQPVPLGLLAGRAVRLALVRRTPIHDWHERAGAQLTDAGDWKRPRVYSSVEQEYDAVRCHAGLIDASTLGKFDFRGRGAAEFFEFMYPNRFANLSVGRVRYGVLCDEAGILLDDGTISRLQDDQFFLTTTTGNAAAIDSWFRWWLAARPGLDVRMTNVSGSYAAMNLAGPRSREILQPLADIDLANAAFPYLAAARCIVAGVPAVVLRLGFVGECSYEIHVPAQFGLAVWEAVLEAGHHAGIQPFGVEAQRLLRLEKKHLLPGIDTDALSNPLEAGLPFVVRLEKPDFIGRQALERAARRGPRQMLVGFRMPDGFAPEPSSLVIHDGRPCGRVTSSGYSPAAGAAVGLAWVPAAIARNGDTIQIQVDGRLLAAVVHDAPFYDPAGDKLRS